MSDLSKQLRTNAEIQRGILDKGCAQNLELAAARIEALEAALRKIIWECDAAPANEFDAAIKKIANTGLAALDKDASK